MSCLSLSLSLPLFLCLSLSLSLSLSFSQSRSMMRQPATLPKILARNRQSLSLNGNGSWREQLQATHQKQATATPLTRCHQLGRPTDRPAEHKVRRRLQPAQNLNHEPSRPTNLIELPQANPCCLKETVTMAEQALSAACPSTARHKDITRDEPGPSAWTVLTVMTASEAGRAHAHARKQCRNERWTVITVMTILRHATWHMLQHQGCTYGRQPDP